MPHRHTPTDPATTTMHRELPSLVTGLLVACALTLASLPALAIEPSTSVGTLPTGTAALEPSMPVAAVALTSSTTPNASNEDAPVVPSAPVAPPAGSSTPALQGASTQFIPYSMTSQAAARLEPAASPALPAAKPKGAESLSAYVADRWSIGQEQALRLVNMAHRAAAEHAVDPLLLLAVAARESGFQYTGNAGSLDAEPNPKKVDPGTAHGLMQVAGRFHPDKMPVDSRGRMRVTTDEENLNIGAQLLRENLSLDQGDVGRALQRYNGNLRDAGQRFARYVLKVRRDLQRAIRVE